MYCHSVTLKQTSNNPAFHKPVTNEEAGIDTSSIELSPHTIFEEQLINIV